jgi:hypothetical protein
MFFARVVFFRLHESPRYLVHAGRPHDAVISLRKISEFNGDNLAIGLGNVEDRRGSVLFTAEDAEVETSDSIPCLSNQRSDEGDLDAREASPMTNFNPNYHSTALSPPPATYEDAVSSSSRIHDGGETETDPFFSDPETKAAQLSDTPARPLLFSSPNQHPVMMFRWKFLQRFPLWVRGPLGAWLGRLAMVLSKEWRSTTLLVWWIWFAIALGQYSFKHLYT